jgi:aspartate 1-decarboxylase
MDTPFRKMLLAKLHGAVVTDANVAYEGSITIPADLLERAGLLPHEAVAVWNVTRGTRFETYILEGEPKRQEIHVNGAAAHLVEVGDTLIVAAFTYLPLSQAQLHEPTAVFLNPDNSVKSVRRERPRTIVE